MFDTYLDLTLKAEGDDQTISGYGSVFSNVDDAGEIIASSAFDSTISAGVKLPMLFNHDRNTVIGSWTDISVDAKGLKVTGKFAPTAKAQEIYALVKSGSINGLSIAGRIKDYEYNGQGNRVLKDISLREVSVVTFPSNSLATIDMAKASDLTIRDFERILRDAGLSKSVSQKLLAGGFGAIAEKSVDPEILELLNQRKTLLK